MSVEYVLVEAVARDACWSTRTQRFLSINKANRSKKRTLLKLQDLRESNEELFAPPQTQTYLTEVWIKTPFNRNLNPNDSVYTVRGNDETIDKKL